MELGTKNVLADYSQIRRRREFATLLVLSGGLQIRRFGLLITANGMSFKNIGTNEI